MPGLYSTAGSVCDRCGRTLHPCPATWDGEPTYVGFAPCMCSRWAWLGNVAVREYGTSGYTLSDHQNAINLADPPPPSDLPLPGPVKCTCAEWHALTPAERLARISDVTKTPPPHYD